MKFKVTWQEDSIYSTTVEAENQDDAYEKAMESENQLCINCEIECLEIEEVS